MTTNFEKLEKDLSDVLALAKSMEKNYQGSTRDGIRLIIGYLRAAYTVIAQTWTTKGTK